ncbi:unnamed protein product [Mytilus coruscus]|uniref:Uncharacterized protein n=1 Tax=Mytilus coruscus TaxID=42192 RepID=A0A6J8ECF9_MYTCO|nr:unnamed protein product [Mytilus coruscus]
MQHLPLAMVFIQKVPRHFDHEVYPEGTHTFKYDYAVITEPVKDGHTEKKTKRTTTSNSDHVVSSGHRAANTYDDGLYPERTKTSNSDHVVSSGQTTANTYDDGLWFISSGHRAATRKTAAYTYENGLYPERTTTSNSDHVVSSGQTAGNTYDDGLYPERTTTSNSDHVVSSRQTAANTYDDVLFLERTTTSNSDHVVSSGQTAANTYDDGLFPERTTTSNSDHVVSSGQTAANTYDDGLYPEWTTTFNSDYVVSSGQTTVYTYDDEWTTTFNSDYVVSSGQTTVYTYDDGLYPERTTTSNSDHVVYSGQTAANTYDDGLYPERTTTSNFDHVVSSGQTAANTYDDGLYPEQITASKSDHRGSSVQTAAYTYEDGLYVERTTPSIFNNGIFSKGSILFRYDNRVYPVSSTRVKYDHGAYPKKTTYKYANGAYQAKISTSKYVNGLNAESVVASNVYHGVYPEGETLYSNGNGVNVKRTTSSKYDADVHPDGTTIYINNYEPTEDINPQGQSRQTKTNKYALGIHLKHGVYREQTTPTIFDKSVLPEWTTRYKYDHSLYHKGTRTSKYGYGVYPEGTTEHLYDNGVTTDPEEKTRLESNVEYGQDFKELLQECQNGTVIQKLLCYPSLEYNVSLVNGIIPYFSDLRIFFADDFQNCKELFNKFIKSKNNVVSNADVHDFLSNDSTCLELASFTNKLVFLMKLNERGSMFTGFVFPYVAANYIVIYVILKQHSCREDFYQYVNLNGPQLPDDELALSIDNIIDFSQVNDCLDVRFSCSSRQHFVDIRIFVPDSAAAYVHMGMAVEVTMVNGFVLFIFLQKENRTPVTILLSFLAVSDVNMVILMILPVYAAPGEHVQHVLGLAYLYLFDFPKCLIYTFIDELKYVFHLTSVFITSLLCLQKLQLCFSQCGANDV